LTQLFTLLLILAKLLLRSYSACLLSSLPFHKTSFPTPQTDEVLLRTLQELRVEQQELRVEQQTRGESLEKIANSFFIVGAEMLETNRNAHNPYILDNLTTESEEGRARHFRGRVLAYYRRQTGKQAARCMVTDELGDSEQVVAAHIIPLKTKKATLKRIGIPKLNTKRNGLVLARNIEMAFDRLRLSFLPAGMGKFAMKLLDPSVGEEFIFEGSAKKIGEFDGCLLQHTHGNPYKRALSYQAHLAHHVAVSENWIAEDTPEPGDFGTPTQSVFQALMSVQEEVFAVDEASGDSDGESDSEVQVAE
jgi:hypothetical protein